MVQSELSYSKIVGPSSSRMVGDHRLDDILFHINTPAIRARMAENSTVIVITMLSGQSEFFEERKRRICENFSCIMRSLAILHIMIIKV